MRIKRGFQTSWTPAAAQAAAEQRRSRVVKAQRVEAQAAAVSPSGIESGGAGGASDTARSVEFLDSA